MTQLSNTGVLTKQVAFNGNVIDFMNLLVKGNSDLKYVEDLEKILGWAKEHNEALTQHLISQSQPPTEN